MFRIIETEFKKLKRYYILLVGFIGMAFPAILSIFTQSVASEGARTQNFDFIALFNSSIWNSVTIFMPIIFTLIGGYIINREYKDQTLKNILPIPLSFRKLVVGKLLTMGLISLFFGLYNFLVTIVVGLINDLGGLNVNVLLNSFIQTMGIAACTYIAVLPIIALTSNKQGAYMGGVVLSFILGYSAMFIKDAFLRSLYPILAGFTIFRFDMSTFMNTREPTYLKLSIMSLVFSFLISIIIIAFLNPKQKSVKNKKDLFSRKRS